MSNLILEGSSIKGEEDLYKEELKPEFNGIGLRNEKSLHSQIKQWYAIPGDRLEVRFEGYIVDLLRGETLIEIQTGNFGAIAPKLRKLLKNHKVILVHPIAKEKWITRMDASFSKVLGRRKSPKRGEVIDIFDELVRMPGLIDNNNLILEVLLIKEEEIRCEDGKGSWRRRGISIRDKKLIEVCEKVIFERKEDFLAFLPWELGNEFTNKMIAEALSIPVYKARKISYCLKKMNLIEEIGKKGRELLFKIKEED